MAAGTKVSDSSIAPVSASTTVIAIGWNIFPSTPVRAKSGRYTAPVARSLMTRTLRLALNTGLAAFASSGNWAASFSSASLQSRT